MTIQITGYVIAPPLSLAQRAFVVYPTEQEARMWGVPRKVCIAEAKNCLPISVLLDLGKLTKETASLSKPTTENNGCYLTSNITI